MIGELGQLMLKFQVTISNQLGLAENKFIAMLFVGEPRLKWVRQYLRSTKLPDN